VLALARTHRIAYLIASMFLLNDFIPDVLLVAWAGA
jgi:hypothetical protein